jgi:hypothetical protein
MYLIDHRFVSHNAQCFLSLLTDLYTYKSKLQYHNHPSISSTRPTNQQQILMRGDSPIPLHSPRGERFYCTTYASFLQALTDISGELLALGTKKALSVEHTHQLLAKLGQNNLPDTRDERFATRITIRFIIRWIAVTRARFPNTTSWTSSTTT